MNLHALVRSTIQVITPDTSCQWMQSTGYTTSPSGKQAPTYALFTVRMQVQGLASREIRHMDSLNIQGVLRKVYAYGNVEGVVRPSLQGGDLIIFAQQYGGIPQVWKVVHPMETWADAQANGWSSAIVALQEDIVSNVTDISSGNVTIDNGQISIDQS